MIPAHLIKHNAGNRMPRHFLYLDTEALIESTGPVQHQRWRLGVTCYDGWSASRRCARPPEWMRWTDPASLWAYVSGIAKPKSRLVVVAHNLGYDLRISRALYLLPAEGWTLGQFSLTARNVMMTWRRGDGASLVMIDSMTYLPRSLAYVANLLGMEKEVLPEQDSEEGWWERCTEDVRILREACRQLWSMIEDKNLGNWQRTGAGMAWANWRHCHYTHKVLVHDNERARDAEQEATYTARCEAWRWGSFVGGPYVEWDLPLAYARVALGTSLPVALVGHIDHVPEGVISRETKTYRYLVRATVSQVAPCLPHHDGTGFYWPSGTFTGWFWEHELCAAQDYGASIEPREAYVYRGRPALSDWANWVIDVAEGEGDDFTALQRFAVKHWARALIGRFAVRYSPWEHFGEGLEGRVGSMACVDRETGERSTLLLLGPDSYESGPRIYGADAVPAINSAIVSEARIRLYDVMAFFGLDNVFYVDTDCVITTAGPRSKQFEAKVAESLWGLREKARHKEMLIYGPRQMTTGGNRRIAGVPRSAKRTSESKFTGESWESLPASLTRRRADSVVVSPAGWKITGVDNRRLHLPGGLTTARTISEAVIDREASQIA